MRRAKHSWVRRFLSLDASLQLIVLLWPSWWWPPYASSKGIFLPKPGAIAGLNYTGEPTSHNLELKVKGQSWWKRCYRSLPCCIKCGIQVICHKTSLCINLNTAQGPHCTFMRSRLLPLKFCAIIIKWWGKLHLLYISVDLLRCMKAFHMLLRKMEWGAFWCFCF